MSPASPHQAVRHARAGRSTRRMCYWRWGSAWTRRSAASGLRSATTLRTMIWPSRARSSHLCWHPPPPVPSVEEALAERLARGEEVVLATVIRVDGQPPSRPGAKLLMSRTASLAGTLGCSEFDSAALTDAPQVADSGAPQLRTYSHDLGSIEAYLEPHAPVPTLVVFGATPVARSLLDWAPELGFRAVLVETRPDRLRDQDWPEAVTSVPALEALMGTEVYAVHTDHDAADIVPTLLAVVAHGPRFIVQDASGEGAMGVVYRAYHPQLERTGAVKVLHGIGLDLDSAARFRREAQAIAQLRHPNVLNVFDFGEYEGTPYMIVEYVPGGSLAPRVKSGPVERTAAIAYLRGIAEALDYAHKHGIVHRDVKPANVLLGPDDNPILADFGMAKDPTVRWSRCLDFVAALETAMKPATASAAEKTIAFAAPAAVDKTVAIAPPVPPRKRAPRAASTEVQGTTVFAGEDAVGALRGPDPAVPHPVITWRGVKVPAREGKGSRKRNYAFAAAAAVLVLLLGVCGYVVLLPTSLHLSRSIVAPGDSIVVSANHISSGQTGQIELHSVIRSYGFRADAIGRVTREVAIPFDIDLGAHTAYICWANPCRASAALQVVDSVALAPSDSPLPGSSPSTGPSPSGSPRSTPGSSPRSSPSPRSSTSPSPTRNPSPTPTPPKPTPTPPKPTPTPSASVTVVSI